MKRKKQKAKATDVMAESEELNSLLMKVKEESEKAGLKLWSPYFRQRRQGDTMEKRQPL